MTCEDPLAGFASSAFSTIHRTYLEEIDQRAARSEICIARKKTGNRETFLAFFPDLALNMRPLDVLNTKTNQYVRSVPVPNNLRAFIQDFCVGSLDAAIMILQQVARDISSSLHVSMPQHHRNTLQIRLEHLQNHHFFLSDIRSVIGRNQEVKRHSTEKTYREVLSNHLETGEHLALFPPRQSPAYVYPAECRDRMLADLPDICGLCYRFVDKQNSKYCQEHSYVDANNNGNNIKTGKLYHRAYRRLELTSHLDTHLDDLELSDKEAKKRLEGKGISTKQLNDAIFLSVHEWAANHALNKAFNERLWAPDIKLLPDIYLLDWGDPQLSKLFHRVVGLTSSFLHTKNIFKGIKTDSLRPENLQNYLIETFYDYTQGREKPDLHRSFTADNFITMLNERSRFELISMAASKTKVRELKKAVFAPPGA